MKAMKTLSRKLPNWFQFVLLFLSGGAHVALDKRDEKGRDNG